MEKDVYVVCRIFKKSGPGPQNGAHYGAPFNEEEWEETDGGMIVLRDDGDDDFYDAGEREQEYLQMNDFLQVNSVHEVYLFVFILNGCGMRYSLQMFCIFC